MRKFNLNHKIISIILIGMAVGCAYIAKNQLPLYKYENDKFPVTLSDKELGQRVKVTLNNRCVVCHSCYNSPCQLKLSSFEGLDRGATKEQIYAGGRLMPTDPTRLFVDEKSTKAWRKRGFFSVVSNLDESLLFNMLTLKKSIHGEPKVPSEESNYCPETKKEFDDFKDLYSTSGMPYAMASISDKEYYEIGEWIRRGGKNFEQRVNLSSRENFIIKKWEERLNGISIKEKIASRYIYEHLFIAHISFKNISGKFFRLVRSKTSFPAEIDEIKSLRPFDDPNTDQFYYRFREIKSTIVHKDHIVYKLSDSKMERYNHLFYDKNWNQSKLFLPPYGEKKSNPFVTFYQLPEKSRYQFLLDDAHYHIKTFIRGPVCKGQIALNVIDDHFTVFYIRPESDIFINNKQYNIKVSDYLDVPAKGENDNLKTFYKLYKVKQNHYLNAKAKMYQKYMPAGYGINDIWDGDQVNDNAVLTVYRHFDSATVLKGFKGGYPKTVWVVDYPILERIYYNLVAGFDVYGNVSHKLSTRKYMDELRIESEDLFLSFIPASARASLRESWYRGKISQLKRVSDHPLLYKKNPSKIKFYSGYYVAEFIENILTNKLSKLVVGKRDDLNCCELKEMKYEKVKTIEDFESMLKSIVNQTKSFVEFMPDLSLLRVQLGNEFKVYTIIRNRAHLNVSFMFFEELALDPTNDRLNILRDYVGSYPNKVFDIKITDSNKFFKALVNLDEKTKDEFYEKFSVKRNSKKMWEVMDWFHVDFKKRYPEDFGYFDLNRLDSPI